MSNPLTPLLLRSQDGACASLHPHGAQLSVWQAAGSPRDRLFLSTRAIHAVGVALRGGVPVIFPQFAAEGPLPKHGFARTSVWQLQGQTQLANGDAQAIFTLSQTPASLSLWPYAFTAQLTVSVGGATLAVGLHIRNSGQQPFAFTAALHSYLAVSQLAEVRLHGLQGLHYRDSAQGNTLHAEQPAALEFAGEIDRIYFNTPASLRLHDGANALQISQSGFTDTVVWNPGAERSAALSDLAPKDYQHFVCVEAASIGQPITLAPGAEWQGSQTLVAL